MIGAVFRILGITGVVSRLARALPGSVAAGLQLGLGLSLAALGIRLIETDIWLGVAISGLMLGLMRYQRSPLAVVAVLVGIGVGQIVGIAPPFPVLDFGLHLPYLVVPTWGQILHGTEFAVLPQIPLTLTNASSLRPQGSVGRVPVQRRCRRVAAAESRNRAMSTRPGRQWWPARSAAPIR